MPEPILSPETPAPIIADQPTNGEPGAPFGAQMEEMLNKAFAEARPEKFKPIAPEKPRETKPAGVVETTPPERETKTPSAETKVPASETKVTPKAAQWKEVNDERDRLRKENESFKSERDKWSKEQIDRTEHETLKKSNKELLDRIQAIAVEKDPRFESYFKGKTETAIALARQAVGETHGERVAKLLQLPDSDWRTNQLEEVMADLGPTRQSRLGAAIVEMDKIHLERSTAISKSKENWEAMQAADRAESQKSAQQLERAFQDTLEKWADPVKGIPLFQKKDGDDTHNAEIQQRVEYARQIVNKQLDADQLSKAALWASSAPGLLKTLMAQSEELKTIRAENEALKAGSPELETTAETEHVDDEKQYEGMTAGEIVAHKVLKAGGWN